MTTVTTFTHSAYTARCIGDGTTRGCQRTFIPSVEDIARVVEHSDSPVTDADAVREGFTLCQHCASGGEDGPMEYPYDYFLNMVWPVVANAVEATHMVGWSPEMGQWGGIMWTSSNRDSDLTVHATPFWEDGDGIEVQVDSTEGDLQHGTLPYTLTGDPDRDAERYLLVMQAYFHGFVDALLARGQW